MPLRLIAISTSASLIAGVAFAQDANFAVLDADNSGGLSLSEVQAVAANVTEAEFATYDADASGELSESEFTIWVSGSQDQ